MVEYGDDCENKLERVRQSYGGIECLDGGERLI